MRQNIFRALDNLSASLKQKKNDYTVQENRVRQKVQAVPRKQREMLSVERQQKVKESLYVFLLNKREENALNQAMVDNNARILDPVSGSNIPISPNKYNKVLLKSRLLSVLLSSRIFHKCQRQKLMHRK